MGFPPLIVVVKHFVFHGENQAYVWEYVIEYPTSMGVSEHDVFSPKVWSTNRENSGWICPELPG